MLHLSLILLVRILSPPSCVDISQKKKKKRQDDSQCYYLISASLKRSYNKHTLFDQLPLFIYMVRGNKIKIGGENGYSLFLLEDPYSF